MRGMSAGPYFTVMLSRGWYAYRYSICKVTAWPANGTHVM